MMCLVRHDRDRFLMVYSFTAHNFTFHFNFSYSNYPVALHKTLLLVSGQLITPQ